MSSPSLSSSSSSPFVPARQSVRDLLAELSDSESGSELPSQPRLNITVSRSIDVEEDTSEDDILVAGASRLARRLAGEAVKPAAKTPELHENQETMERASEAAEDGDEAAFRPMRKMLLKRKITRSPRGSPNANNSTSGSISLSPAGSPFSGRSDRSSASSIQRLPALTQKLNDAAESSKSRFSALVEKARKQRLACEEQERAKKEAIAAQESTVTHTTHDNTGLDISDVSDGDSDASELATAKRLTKDSRPMRKASKKALEEMNRETQRMNRSMQLAHQTKTKKKFTKESFFASFVYDLPMNGVTQIRQTEQLSLGSANGIMVPEGQRSRHHSTPPTSPLPDVEVLKLQTVAATIDSSTSVSNFTEVCPDLVLPQVDDRVVLNVALANPTKSEASRNTKATIDWRELEISSDSDLDVITDTASKRKFSAFENLPRKKAKEMPSHIVLRSLANVKREKSMKSPMTSAEMGPNLLRAARKQAHDERQAKIERLKAAGVVIQTVEEREKEEEELEDLVEKARQEDEQIRKREKELAKKDGTFQKDILDEEDSDEEDEDFDDHNTDGEDTESDSEDGDEDGEKGGNEEEEEVDGGPMNNLIDDAASESAQDSESDDLENVEIEQEQMNDAVTPIANRTVRRKRVIEDDDEDTHEYNQASETPILPVLQKTPYSVMRSARKVIPGLQNSDDLPIGLTQAFAATMADSQTQREELDGPQSINVLSGLPSPNVDLVPQLRRLESVDLVAESVSGSQNPPLGLNFDLPQSQRILESPVSSIPYSASQPFFELTQDNGYKFSPFAGRRFADTPRQQPHSTKKTLIFDQVENSPIVQRQGRLQRGRQTGIQVDETTLRQPKSAFAVMDKAAKRKIAEDFNRKKSEARQAIDEAAEESDDEYAGLGGASGEDTDEEANEEDRNMIDEDTQVGKGDEAKLAKLYADRERESDEAAVSKLLKDITTGALRRKRGVGDDLDLSDEEDNAALRRSAKQREFERMRRALLKDEAIGKIAEDKRKEAFLRSIEDRDDADTSDGEGIEDVSQLDVELQTNTDPEQQDSGKEHHDASQKDAESLTPSKDSQLNKFNFGGRRTNTFTSRKPVTLAEIRESVSFLVEEPDSRNATIGLGLSDSEEEPEAYINLDRHFQQAEADEHAEEDDNDDLGDFIVDDQRPTSETQDDLFKKPDLPNMQPRDRAPFSERRTKAANVVDRLSLLRQASSSTSTSKTSSKMAFFTSNAGPGSLSGGPSLLRRATTNSSLGSFSGRDNVSATGVVTSKTERGSAKEEKKFVRKGNTTSRNAVNYQGRQNLKEERMSIRAGVTKRQQKKKGGNGFLSGLLRGDTWS